MLQGANIFSGMTTAKKGACSRLQNTARSLATHDRHTKRLSTRVPCMLNLTKAYCCCWDRATATCEPMLALFFMRCMFAVREAPCVNCCILSSRYGVIALPVILFCRASLKAVCMAFSICSPTAACCFGMGTPGKHAANEFARLCRTSVSRIKPFTLYCGIALNDTHRQGLTPQL